MPISSFAALMIVACTALGCGARSILDGEGPVACAPARGRVTLASNLFLPRSIAVDATSVYWVTADDGYVPGAVMSCGKCGCGDEPTMLASGPGPGSLAVGGGTVFWSEYSTGQILACAASGCGGSPTPIGAGSACQSVSCQSVAANADAVYWTTSGAILMCPVTGCDGPPTVVASDPQLASSGIALDATSLYWATSGSVLRCPLAGCAGHPTVLATGQANPVAIAVGGSRVYWINGAQDMGSGSVMQCAVDGCGQSPTQIGWSDATSWIAADASGAYWSDYSGAVIYACAASGCGGNPTLLAKGVYGVGIAVDATSVYFSNYSSVMELTPK